MDVVAGDSGVETEFDLESNDSSMSGLSGGAGGGGLAVPLQPLPEVMIMMMMHKMLMVIMIMIMFIITINILNMYTNPNYHQNHPLCIHYAYSQAIEDYYHQHHIRQRIG